MHTAVHHCAVVILASLCIASTGSADEEHPLDEVIVSGRQALVDSERVKDYSATLVKRERIDGKLQEYEYCFLKVRHEPFSVYLKFLAPDSQKGRECIYVEGQNNGKMLAHERGRLGKAIGTVALRVDGRIAMQGQRYPITDIGIKNLAEQLIRDAENGRQLPVKCNVRKYPHAKVGGRLTTCIVVQFPERHEELAAHIGRVFIDEELNIPIRYEGYDWPSEEGGKPVLVEEYTYQDIKLNQGFTDLDFDKHNPAYAFE